MSSPRSSAMRRLLGGMLPVLALVSVVSLWKLAADNDYLGKGDFLAYWSAARLLRDGRDPYDPAAMEHTEREFTHASFDTPIMAENPPTVFVLTLPMAWLSFPAAKALWVVIDVAQLLAASLILIHLYPPSTPKALLALGLLWALFPQILVGILAGQVTYLVLLGLVSSLYLMKRGKWFWAGASLILTTIKPHMVVLAVPYILLYMAHRRKWQGWLGAFVAGGICLLILSAFRPSWPTDWMAFIFSAPFQRWATPTIGGLMSEFHLGEFWRCAVAVFLPLSFMLARRPTATSPQTAVSLLTVITVPTTFYGWSYDQCMLLIPIAEMLGWLQMSPRHSARAIVGGALFLVILANWLQRITVTSEVYYVWIPLAIAALYGLYCVTGHRERRAVSA